MRQRRLLFILLLAFPLRAEAASPKVEVGGEIFAQYGWQTTGGYNAFDLTRMYFSLRGDLSEDLRGHLISDLTRTSNGDFQWIPRYAYLEADAGNGSWHFGLIPSLWTGTESSVWGYRFQGETLSSREGWFCSSDLGLSWGHIEEGMEVDLGVFNGEGRKLETDGRKQYQAKLTFKLPRSWKAYGFYSGVNPGSGSQRTWIGMLAYKTPAATWAAMQAWTRDGSAVEGTAFSTFSTLNLGSLHPALSPYEAIARYNRVLPDGGDRSRKETLIGGVSFRLQKGCQLLLDDEWTTYADGRASSNVLALHSKLTF